MSIESLAASASEDGRGLGVEGAGTLVVRVGVAGFVASTRALAGGLVVWGEPFGGEERSAVFSLEGVADIALFFGWKMR